MQINYAGNISKDDFFKALSLHSKQRYRLYGGIMGGGLALLVLWMFYLALQGPDSDEAFRYATFGASILIVASTFPVWLPLLQLSAYNQKGNIYRNNVFGSINDIGITINNAEANINLQWSAFDNYKDSKDLFMLYQGKNYFNLFVPSMFSDQQEWEKFVTFAKNKVALNKESA